MDRQRAASGLATKYLNGIFVVGRGDYVNLGALMIAATVISLAVPLATIAVVMSRIKLGAAAEARTYTIHTSCLPLGLPAP